MEKAMRYIGAAGRAAGVSAVAAVLLLAGAGCGKKGPPFLPVPTEARELKVERVLLKGGAVTVRFRVPRERFSFEREEERWSAARLLRGSTRDPGGFEERAVLREEEGFPFGALREIADPDGGADGGFVYLLELHKADSKELAVSAKVPVRGLAAPGAPVGLSAEGREGAVSLSWQDAGGEARYVVLRRGEGEEISLAATPEPLSSPRFVDTGVRKERTYCYRVMAVAGEGVVAAESPLSEEACAAGVDETPPPPPGNILVVPAGGGVKISWIPSEAGDVRGYNIYRSLGAGAFEKINGAPIAGSSYLDDEVEPGVAYRYRLTAVDDSSRSNESALSPAVEGSAPAR